MPITYLHAKKKKLFSVKKLLHASISGPQPGRPLKRIHASAITNTQKQFCPREHCIYSITDVQPVDEFIDTATGVTFAHGYNVQRMINEHWLRDIMVGDWKCDHCGNVREFSKYPKNKCTNCQGSKWTYNEMNVVSEYSGISGGLDVVLDVGLSKFVIVEVKTIDKDIFKELLAPKAEHRERTLLYLRLISESNHPAAKHIDTTVASILYVSKAYGIKSKDVYEYGFRDRGLSPFKEFRITADHDSVEKLSLLGKQVIDFRSGKAPIPGKICPSIVSTRAKKCCCFKQCFSKKYPDNKYVRPE